MKGLEMRGVLLEKGIQSKGERFEREPARGMRGKWERKEKEMNLNKFRLCSTGRATKHGPVLHSGWLGNWARVKGSAGHGACWATRPRVPHCLKCNFELLDSREKPELNTGRVP